MIISGGNNHQNSSIKQSNATISNKNIAKLFEIKKQRKLLLVSKQDQNIFILSFVTKASNRNCRAM